MTEQQQKAVAAAPNKMVAGAPNKAVKAEETKRAAGVTWPPETRRMRRRKD